MFSEFAIITNASFHIPVTGTFFISGSIRFHHIFPRYPIHKTLIKIRVSNIKSRSVYFGFIKRSICFHMSPYGFDVRIIRIICPFHFDGKPLGYKIQILRQVQIECHIIRDFAVITIAIKSINYLILHFNSGKTCTLCHHFFSVDNSRR